MTDEQQVETPEQLIEGSNERVSVMLKCMSEAERDETKIPELRSQIKKWITMLKPDVLAQYTLQMIGDGKRNAYDLQLKMEQVGDALDDDLRQQLDRQLEDTNKKITQVCELVLKSDRHSRTAEELRDEVKKWLDGLSLDALIHFGNHHIGMGTAFAKFVQNIDEPNNA